MIKKYLKHTPSRSSGSSKLFRNLEDKGIISYSEYLFLLCVITSKALLIFGLYFKIFIYFKTEPKSNFRIAFNMFDTDGNERVEKNEFLVVGFCNLIFIKRLNLLWQLIN